MRIWGEKRRGQGRIAARAGALAALLALSAAALAPAAIQKDGIRVALSGKLAPKALPRHGVVPVAVTVGGRISAAAGRPLAHLQHLAIEVNRHGRFDYAGLATCRPRQIQPATTEQALAACRDAKVGEGSFTARVALQGQPASESKGRLLVFNGREGGRPVLLGHIYTAEPFTNSFLIAFKLERINRGAFGTALEATMPASLSDWGYVTGIEMTLSRRYTRHGAHHSYISAGCPAPAGLTRVPFTLARASFSFEGGRTLSSTVGRSCRVRG
jgi:hypothetical protein